MTWQLLAAAFAAAIALTPLPARPDDGPVRRDGSSLPEDADALPGAGPPWGALYVGGHLGYAGGTASTAPPDSAPLTSSTFGTLAGGLHAGYARLLGPGLLLGLEADVSVPNFLEGDDRLSSSSTSAGQVDDRIDAFGALRARIGHAFSRGLVYGTGGLAWSLRRFTLDSGAGPPEERRLLRPGWTLGAGLELPVAPGWAARLEYAYQRFERVGVAFASGPRTASAVDLHGVQLGLSWRIGSPGGDASRAERADAPAAGEGRAPDLAATADVAFPVSEDRVPGDRARVPAGDDWNVHGQATFVGQGYPGFPSPYQGAKSLSGTSQVKSTASATAYLGLRPWKGGEVYVNPELMQGFGLSDTQGVAGFPNGEAQRSNFPTPRFNVARAFLSQTFALGDEAERVEDGPNQLAGERAVSRVTVTAGKFAVTDFFLVNAYAGEPRTTFLNWNVYGGGSYDWTMDLLSWTWGAFAELNQERWALRAGYFLLPRVSNTNEFDLRVPGIGQYTAELELRHSPLGRPGKVQLFGWLSHGNIGSYPEALAQPATAPGYPDVKLTRGRDRFNYGFVLGLEQSIAEAFGVFSRVSWSPERGESMGWTDCGWSFSLGGALRGAWWHRPDDTLGVAGLVEGLSPVAQRYFAAGGLGTIIGDRGLDYRTEKVLEVYYAYGATRWATATLDYQLVVNPGYNADRGPVSVFAVRLHAAF